ncbi:hypothetical protein FLONG3_10609 [Fusarium longipes]|uniref:Uncharacterized protein n=1 Tax=Fusarium longipes TaxID=694270 RepID=A0A395RMF0_9HYPO|nr:hypothetical protein FLONG3_10609 [Fusarium longipes]
MATPNSTPTLLTMPAEIMVMISAHSETFQSKVNLARTCSVMYDTLIDDIYRQASKSESLARTHIYEACRDGNIPTLERSFQAEALSISRLDHQIQQRFNRPLYTAIQFYQVRVVQWLLARGADPNFVGQREISMPMLFDSPLQVAVQSTVMPGIPEWCIPEKWYRMGSGFLSGESALHCK